MHRRRFAWVALLGFALAPTFAHAQAPPVFYACAKADGKLKNLRVNTPPTCPVSQTLVSWSEAAPDPTTLPSGATLRGIWGSAVQLGFPITYSGAQIVNISFPLRLAAIPSFHPLTHWMLQTESTADCPGFVDGNFQAAPGHLCVYQTNTDELSGVESKTAQWSSLGIRLILSGPDGGGEPGAEGVWVVTAP